MKKQFGKVTEFVKENPKKVAVIVTGVVVAAVAVAVTLRYNSTLEGNIDEVVETIETISENLS